MEEYYFTNNDFPQFGVLQLSIMLVSSIITFLAIVVSLEKESILNIIHPVKLEPSLKDNGLTEDADTEQTDVKATSYTGNLLITNNSSVPAMNVILEIIGLEYKTGETYHPCSLNKNCIVKLTGDDTTMDILAKRSLYVPLFIISAPNAQSVPDDTMQQNPQLIIKGLEEVRQPSHNNWKITYRLTHKHGASEIAVVINWDGSWKNRKSEMQDCCTVKLLKL